MPSWEASANNMAYQFFPGELVQQGSETSGGNGIKSPTEIPANYYADPDRYGFRAGSVFPTHAVDLQGGLALYDVKRQDTAGVVSELDTGSRPAFQSPRTWRTSWFTEIDVAEAPTEHHHTRRVRTVSGLL